MNVFIHERDVRMLHESRGGDGGRRVVPEGRNRDQRGWRECVCGHEEFDYRLPCLDFPYGVGWGV